MSRQHAWSSPLQPHMANNAWSACACHDCCSQSRIETTCFGSGSAVSHAWMCQTGEMSRASSRVAAVARRGEDPTRALNVALPLRACHYSPSQHKDVQDKEVKGMGAHECRSCWWCVRHCVGGEWTGSGTRCCCEAQHRTRVQGHCEVDN